MISYVPFYETLAKRNLTEYALIFKHGIPANTLHRMKHGEAITTKTIDALCDILKCSVSDIIEFVPPEDVQHIPPYLPQISPFTDIKLYVFS